MFLAPKCEFQLRPTVQYSIRDSSRPYSVAVGHLNSDNYVDVVVANSGFDNVSILFGYGNNSFASQTTYSMGTGSAPRMVAVGDFNNDHQSDIVVANFGTNSIVVLFGNGDGHFSDRTTIDTSPSHPLYLIGSDFNNDGYFDIAFAGYGTDRVGILLGFGNGTFRTKIDLSTGYDSLSYSIAVGDLNDDDRQDIVVANYGTDNIGLFFGIGNGTFSNQTTYSTGSNSGPYSIAIFDLNNDTHLDIAVVYADSHYIAVLLGYGNGSFAKSTLYKTGEDSRPIFIAIADFSTDNKPDITVLNNGSNSVMLLFGYGNGTFANPLTYSTGPHSSPSSIGVGDFNNDNQLDVIIANQENNNIKIFNSHSQQNFSSGTIFSTDDSVGRSGISRRSVDMSSDPSTLTIDNVNNNSQSDITTASYRTNNADVSLEDDNSKFSRQTVNYTDADDLNDNHQSDDGAILSRQKTKSIRSRRYSIEDTLCSMCVVVSDFDNDGQPDIAITNYLENNVGILLGYGNGSFANPIILATSDWSGPIAISAGDFNNDSCLDIVVANYDMHNIGIFLGHGNGEFQPQVPYSINGAYGPLSLSIGDSDNDGRLDIFVAYDWSSNVAVFLGHGDGTFSHKIIYYTGSNSQLSSIITADFDKDGRLDVAVAVLSMNKVDFLFGSGNGTFQRQKSFFTVAYSIPNSLAAGDFNNDGNVDIVVSDTEPEHEHLLILLGKGDGDFFIHSKYASKINSLLCSIVIGNFNNDSLLDIIVANSDAKQVGVFFGYGDGTFTSLTSYPTNNINVPISIAVGDFNSDNRTDLAVADYQSPIVGIFLAYIDVSFVDRTTYFTGTAASPAGMVVRDFTNDGQLDVVVGNDGTHDIDILINNGKGQFSMQTAYSADSTFYPTFIIAYDFNGDKQLDIAVANSVKDTITLLYGLKTNTFGKSRVYSTGTNSIPQSLASGDFNNDKKLDIAVAYSGTGSVGLLLNIDTGAMESFGNLSTGINSKPGTMTVADFDNDDRLDIAVVNNGQANIGFFFGLGDGTFSQQMPIPIGEGNFPVWIDHGDFNNDRQLDVVIANYIGDPTVIVLLGNVNRTFRALGTHGVNCPFLGAVGDFNNDSYLDVVFCQCWIQII